MSIGCWVLLIAALVVLAVGCILAIIALCALNPYVGIAAAIVFGVGLILLFLWLFLCAHQDCKMFNWLRWIVIWILIIAPIVGLLIWTIGKDWKCALAATLILWAYWGSVLAILDIVGPRIGCPLAGPPFP